MKVAEDFLDGRIEVMDAGIEAYMGYDVLQAMHEYAAEVLKWACTDFAELPNKLKAENASAMIHVYEHLAKKSQR